MGVVTRLFSFQTMLKKALHLPDLLTAEQGGEREDV